MLKAGEDDELMPQGLEAVAPAEVVFLKGHLAAVKRGAVDVVPGVWRAGEGDEVGVVAQLAIWRKERRGLGLVHKQLRQMRLLTAALHEPGQLGKERGS